MTAEEIRRTGFPWVLLKIHFSNLLYVCTILNLFPICISYFFAIIILSSKEYRAGPSVSEQRGRHCRGDEKRFRCNFAAPIAIVAYLSTLFLIHRQPAETVLWAPGGRHPPRLLRPRRGLLHFQRHRRRMQCGPAGVRRLPATDRHLGPGRAPRHR